MQILRFHFCLHVCRLLALPLLALLLSLSPGQAFAEAQVFDLTNPNPDEIVRVLQTTYGDKVRIDVIQQRLVVVGSRKQLDEIAALLAKLDRPPAPLRLTLRETPPQTAEHEGTVVYSSGDDGRVIDTVEGALVGIDYQQVVQQPSSNGWLVAIENQPQTVTSLTLQIQLQNTRTAQVLVSFADERNQQRRVFANTLTGEIGAWIPLLPQKAGQIEGPGTYSTGPKRGEQVYLRVERRTR
jgi:hypothetical protein